MTTYASWRWVFAGEVVLVAVIVLMARRLADGERDADARLDLVGTGLSALGLGLIVFGILRAGAWGFVNAKPGARGGWARPWCGSCWGPRCSSCFSPGRRRLWRVRRCSSTRDVQIPASQRADRLLLPVLPGGLFFCVPLYLSVAPVSAP